LPAPIHHLKISVLIAITKRTSNPDFCQIKSSKKGRKSKNLDDIDSLFRAGKDNQNERNLEK